MLKEAYRAKQCINSPRTPYATENCQQSSIRADQVPQKVSGVHISDLTALYGLIIEKILRKEALPSGTEGYYFALAHSFVWWEVLDHLAAALKARDLITDTKVQAWANDEAAAEVLGIPVPFVQPLWNSG